MALNQTNFLLTTYKTDYQIKNYYQILQVEQNATLEAIKKSYRDLATILHPDKQVDVKKQKIAEKQFKLVNEAYEMLSYESKRLQYDIELKSLKETKPSNLPIKKNYELFGFTFTPNEFQFAGIILITLVFLIGFILGNNKKTLFS